MKSSRMLHVLTDRNGKILGAGFLDSASRKEGEVQIQITPLKGQFVGEVPVPQELAKLDTTESFQRLITGFRLPRGKKELVPNRVTQRPSKSRSAR